MAEEIDKAKRKTPGQQANDTIPMGAGSPSALPGDAMSTRSPGTRASTGGAQFAELGVSGLKDSRGVIIEEFLPQLAGHRAIHVYRQMRDNDSIIGALMFAITNMLRPVKIRAEPADTTTKAKKEAEFADSLLQDMETPLEDFMSEALTMLEFGWSMLEVVLKNRVGPEEEKPEKRSKFDDGRIGVRKLAPRAQDTLWRWEIAQDGTVLGMWQMPPLPVPGKPMLIFLPIERCILLRTVSRKSNPEGISILRNAYRCFSDDTELLTEAGWKLAKNVTKGDRLATLNPASNEMEYHAPNRLYAFPYRGKMFRQHSRRVDLCVTPNHRMWVRRDRCKDFEFIEAAKLPKRVCYKQDAIWNGAEAASFVLPEWSVEQRLRTAVGAAVVNRRTNVVPAKTLVMDDWLRFLGIWLAEGCTHQKKTGQKVVYISQKPGKKLDTICSWVEACGFHYNIKKAKNSPAATIEICSAQLFDYLKQFGKSHDKFIPRDLMGLSKRQLSILFDAMWLGDGRTAGSGTRLYATVSRRLADDVSELLLKIGYAPRVYWQKGTGHGDGVWIVSCVTPKANGTWVNEGSDCREWIDYDSKVYCVEVENHLVYARRNGRACWSGNSWWYATRVEEMEAIGIERELAGAPVIRLPSRYFRSDATDREKAVLNEYKTIARDFKKNEQGGLVIPSDPWFDADGKPLPGAFQVDVELISSAGSRQIDTDKIVSRHQTNIARSVLADFIMLGTQQQGAYALSKNKTDLFLRACETFINIILAGLNRSMLPQVWEANNLDPALMPAYHAGRVAPVNLVELGGFLRDFAGAGAELFPDIDLENHVREMADLPEKTEEAIQAQNEAAQQALAQMLAGKRPPGAPGAPAAPGEAVAGGPPVPGAPPPKKPGQPIPEPKATGGASGAGGRKANGPPKLVASKGMPPEYHAALALKFNPNHEPAGSPEGGRFASADGGGGGSADEKGSEVGKHPGHGYSKGARMIGGKIHTDNVYDAARALYEGKKVELTQPRQVSTLVDHLAEVSRRMVDRGADAPNFNLCGVSVRGTNLFCADSKGIPRPEMPQLSDDDQKGFRKYLEGKGYEVSKEKEQASYLRATQKELIATKVAKFVKQIDDGTVGDKRLFISKDNYIVDGHHHWAAKLAVDARDGRIGDENMKILRVDTDIITLLGEAKRYLRGVGKSELADLIKIDIDGAPLAYRASTGIDLSDVIAHSGIIRNNKASAVTFDINEARAVLDKDDSFPYLFKIDLGDAPITKDGDDIALPAGARLKIKGVEYDGDVPVVMAKLMA